MPTSRPSGSVDRALWPWWDQLAASRWRGFGRARCARRRVNEAPEQVEETFFFRPATTVQHNDNRAARAIDMACAVVTGALLTLTAMGWVGFARILLTFAFAVYVPGWAVVANCAPMVRGSRLALPVLVSVTLVTAAATVTIWLHVWHPVQLFDIEASASIALIGIAAVRRESRRPPGELVLRNVAPGDTE